MLNNQRGGDWNMNFMTFHILGIIIPSDELIFFRGVGIPPTSHGLFKNKKKPSWVKFTHKNAAECSE